MLTFRLSMVLLFWVLLLLPLAEAGAQPLTSTWWYPNGTPEGTRNNPATTKLADTANLQIIWRTESLKNSPVLLAGKVRQEGANQQQIIGLESGSHILRFLDAFGRMYDTVNYDETIDPSTPYTLTLTGLFNSEATMPNGVGVPNLLGLGIEREQRGETQLNGILSQPNGRNGFSVRIPTLASNDPSYNRIAGVYPAAAFMVQGKPTVFAIASQNQFRNTTPSTPDSIVNGVYRYTNSGNGFVQTDRFPIAPGVYPQAPAITITDSSAIPYIAPSTRSLIEPAGQVIPAGQGVTPTLTTRMYGIGLKVDDKLAHVETRRFTSQTSQNDTLGETNSYFVRMYDGRDRSQLTFPSEYRLVTTNFSEDRPGVPSITLLLTQDGLPVDQSRGIFSINTVKNVGWTILSGNVDGNDTSKQDPGVDGEYPNNPGNEVLAAYRQLDGRDVDSNYLFFFQRNGAREPNNGGRVFWNYTAWPFKGRLMAVADIVRDADTAKQEIIIAHSDSLIVLQMNRYADVLLSTVDASRRQWFRQVKAFKLDSRVVAVAVADLQGNGTNTIVATTERATYAIGTAIENPLGEVTTKDEYCRGEQATARWGARRVGGGEQGLRVIVRASTGTDSVMIAELKPATDSGTFTFPTGQLLPGSYTLLLQDNAVPTLSATSLSFTITGPSIKPLVLPRSQYRPGDAIAAQTVIRCASNLRLERALGSGNDWEAVPATITYLGDTAFIQTNAPCLDPCPTQQTARLRFRLVDTSLAGVESVADTITLLTEPIQLSIDSGAARARLLRWNPNLFDCDSVELTITTADAAGVKTVSNRPGIYDLNLPRNFAGTVTARLCCGSGSSSCTFGRAAFELEPIEVGTYAQPNPFNPMLGGRESIVEIFYDLELRGSVTITIYDASRALVRQLLRSGDKEAGLNVEQWDGRNSDGAVVANGTYICVVESSSGEQSSIPILILKR
ncbi:MAG: hypothetical protein IPM61_15985 [Chlorobi bacterium]|nr:hypothetical protein [Chlorobiota bacterium]